VTMKGSRGGQRARSGKGNGGRAASARAAEGKRKRGRPPRTAAEATQASFPGERVIHRYANRRFYDLRESRAITLHELGELARQRQSVRVIDVDGGNVDITRRVLGQILVETGGEALELLPVELLRRLLAPLDKGTLAWTRQFLAVGADLLERGAPRGSARANEAREKLARLVEERSATDQVKASPPEAVYNPVRAVKERQINERIEELRQRLEDLSKMRGY